MYYITKVFHIPMAHRLSKNVRSCQFLHGHNIIGKITIKSHTLDKNDMVMDFHDLKNIVEGIINSWDHGLFLNKVDEHMVPIQCKLHLVNNDPTSEILSKILYDEIAKILPEGIEMESVSLIEAEGSEATYKEN